MKAARYQLWLDDLGEDPDAVVTALVDDITIAGMVEAPSDLPELPWMMLELPAGSDTYSFIRVKAGELQNLGAKVSVREVKPFFKKILLAALAVGLLIGFVFVLMLNSARLELREMHEHEVQEILKSQE